jgi:hypothetical protein
METVNKATTPNAASEQGTGAAPQRKGGFIQDAAVAQGCCGETSGGSSGCCGAPAQAVVPTATVQPTTQASCCGAAPTQTEANAPARGCCG